MKLGIRLLGVSWLSLVATSAVAAVTTIPQSSLISSTTYYTNDLGSVALPRNDDGSSAILNLGFNLTLFGNTYTQFYINNNGNISFNGSISAYVPTGPQGASQPIISPFFSDVDTRPTNGGTVHLNQSVVGQTVVTWDGVGYFSNHTDRFNSFQLVVRGDDFVVPTGEGQIGFFYKDMQWDATDTNRVSATGFGDGVGNGNVLEGSIQPGLANVLSNHHIWFNVNDNGGGVIVVPPPAVPEPETYAMMLAGLGLIGFSARRKKQA